jgi:uncharacterized protein
MKRCHNIIKLKYLALLTSTMHQVIYFEMLVSNTDTAMNFYKAVFGWNFDPIPGPPGKPPAYWTITTGDGNLIGGLVSIPPATPFKDPSKNEGNRMTNSIAVSSIDETLNKITAKNGKIVKEKKYVEKFGYLAICQDPLEITFGVIQWDKP